MTARLADRGLGGHGDFLFHAMRRQDLTDGTKKRKFESEKRKERTEKSKYGPIGFRWRGIVLISPAGWRFATAAVASAAQSFPFLTFFFFLFSRLSCFFFVRERVRWLRALPSFLPQGKVPSENPLFFVSVSSLVFRICSCVGVPLPQPLALGHYRPG